MLDLAIGYFVILFVLSIATTALVEIANGVLLRRQHFLREWLMDLTAYEPRPTNWLLKRPKDLVCRPKSCSCKAKIEAQDTRVLAWILRQPDFSAHGKIDIQRLSTFPSYIDGRALYRCACKYYGRLLDVGEAAYSAELEELEKLDANPNALKPHLEARVRVQTSIPALAPKDSNTEDSETPPDSNNKKTETTQAKEAKAAVSTVVKNPLFEFCSGGRERFEERFEEAEKALRSRFARSTRVFTFFAGLTLAVSLNVDAITIFDGLYQQQLSDAARESDLHLIGWRASELPWATLDPGSMTEDEASPGSVPHPSWAEFIPRKSVGLGAMALLLSLGSPFWFEVLGQLMSIKARSGFFRRRVVVTTEEGSNDEPEHARPTSLPPIPKERGEA